VPCHNHAEGGMTLHIQSMKPAVQVVTQAADTLYPVEKDKNYINSLQKIAK